MQRSTGGEQGEAIAKRRRASYSKHKDEWERTMLILHSRARVPSTGKRGAERLEDVRARVRRRIEVRARSSNEALSAEQRACIAAKRAAATVEKLAKEAARGKEEEEEVKETAA